MALAVPILTTDLFKAPEPVAAPVLSPVAAPVYVEPVSVPIPAGPLPAPPPSGQTRGEGGTPFALRPLLYFPPLFCSSCRTTDGLYDPVLGLDPDTPAPLTPETKARAGDSLVMPVLRTPDPARPAVAPVVQAVPVPVNGGPVKGEALGVNLSTVPLWAWLVGAAIVGAKVLR